MTVHAPDPQLARKTLGFFWSHVRPLKWGYGVGLLGVGTAMTIDALYLPYLYSQIYDLMAEQGTAALPQIWQQLAWAVGLHIIGVNLAWRLAGLTMAHVHTRLIDRIRRDCFARLQERSYTFFANTFTGSLVSRVTRITSAAMVLNEVLTWQIWTGLVVLVGTVGTLTWWLPWVGGAMAVWTVFYVWFLYRFARWRLQYQHQQAAMDSKVGGALADAMTNFLAIKTFAAAEREQERFGVISEENWRIHRFTWWLGEGMRVVQGTLMGGLIGGVMWGLLSAWGEGTGGLTTGQVIMGHYLLLRLYRSLFDINRIIQSLFRAFADSAEMVDTIYGTPLVRDCAEPEACRISRGEITLVGVGFAYPDDPEAAVLADFNLTVKAGERVGIVGHSGSGKSTLTKLLLRFVEPQVGRIIVDGQDINVMRQVDLRRAIAYVPQESLLFHRSIADNIAYHQPSANRAAIEQAAQQAQAHGFIMQTPQGYDTLVGERGIKLSGGEKQRIAIARALMKPAPILVLDEATSALDSVSEGAIQQALGELMQGRTTLVIAHRLSTIQQLDRIVVLAAGQIVEQGTHGELLALGGEYATLWERQSGGFLSAD